MGLVFNNTNITSIIYNGTAISQLVYNGTVVWPDATAGDTTLGIFRGGEIKTNSYTNLSFTMNVNMAIVSGETAAGEANGYGGGSGISSAGFFYGGFKASTGSNKSTKVSNSNTLVSEVSLGTARGYLGGSRSDTNSVFFGGSDNTANNSKVCTRVTTANQIAGSETSLGTARWGTAGGFAAPYAVFYGGWNGAFKTPTNLNITTRINSSGAIVGSETNIGDKARASLGGAHIDSFAIFWSGQDSNGTRFNIATRINSSGALYGSETSVGTARIWTTGASIAGFAIFHGGIPTGGSTPGNNTATKINNLGALAATEISVGTNKMAKGGAGV